MSSVRQRVITLLKSELGLSTHDELYDSYVSESSIKVLKSTSGIESEKIDEVLFEFRIKTRKSAGGSISARKAKQRYDFQRMRPFIVAGIAVVVVAIAAFAYFGGGRGQGAVGGDQQSATVGSSDGSDSARYERLSPEGKKYVDDQMRAYDEHCARDPNC